MIKFFRKIREDLLVEGKTARYLKYAFGEIVLVVIGILIALQINNWNNNSIEQNKESHYLKNLRRDLNDQLLSIDSQIEYETRFTEDAGYLITYFNNNAFAGLDSIFFSKLSYLHSRKTFIINDPTLTDLLSSGNIDLIRSQDFKDNLIRYYQELRRIEKVIQNNNSFLVDEQFGGRFLEIGYFYTNLANEENIHVDQVKSLKLTSIYYPELSKISQELLNEPENKLDLMNMINMRHTVSLSHLGLMQDSRQSTQNLIEELEAVIHD